jgi:hypothetical protein
MSARLIAPGLTGVCVLLASAAYAQTTTPTPTPTPPVERLPIRASVTSDTLSGLPSAATVFSLLDTAFAEIIADRVDAGSLTAAQASRLGAHGSSWTQTMFRIGQVDISDPRGGGTPLVIPGVIGWQGMTVDIGALPMDANAAGPVVTLVPMRPAASWSRRVELWGAPTPLLAGTKMTTPPAITRLDGWRSMSLLASGPLAGDRIGIVVGGSVTSSTYFERADPTTLRDTLGSAFTHLVFTPNERNEVRVTGIAQRARSPFDHRTAYGQPSSAERDRALHLQSEWDRRRDGATFMTGFASFSTRRRTTDLEPVSAIVSERLTDGPVPVLVAPLGTDKVWSMGGRLTPRDPSGRHAREAGVSLSGAIATAGAPFSVRVGELVGGLPARVWDYSASGRSRWRQDTLAAYVGDSFAAHPRVTLDGSLRFEAVSGRARGNPRRILWYDWYPALGLRWELVRAGRTAFLARFHRYGHRLPLDFLGYGDSSASTASVYRWAATGADPDVARLGPLVSYIGPGTNGDPDLVSLDPALERPHASEVIFGFESRPGGRSVLRLLASAQREGQLVGLVDVGVPASAYVPVVLSDPGVDHAAGRELIAYDLPPATFGQNQYVLTNPPRHHSTFVSVEASLQTTLNRLFLMAGATAGRAEQTSAYRGFLATENDHALIGDVFTNPNAEKNSRGRPFTERGYTIKMAGTWRFSDTTRLGVSARYQDGQHFSRLVIVPGLNQGPEAIRAFINGYTRFTYTMTYDARLEKAFVMGGRRLAMVLDAYNLTNERLEIESVAETGPHSRAISAVTPPRSVRIGLRWAF